MKKPVKLGLAAAVLLLLGGGASWLGVNAVAQARADAATRTVDEVAAAVAQIRDPAAIDTTGFEQHRARLQAVMDGRGGAAPTTSANTRAAAVLAHLRAARLLIVLALLERRQDHAASLCDAFTELRGTYPPELQFDDSTTWAFEAAARLREIDRKVRWLGELSVDRRDPRLSLAGGSGNLEGL